MSSGKYRFTLGKSQNNKVLVTFSLVFHFEAAFEGGIGFWRRYSQIQQSESLVDQWLMSFDRPHGADFLIVNGHRLPYVLRPSRLISWTTLTLIQPKWTHSNTAEVIPTSHLQNNIVRKGKKVPGKAPKWRGTLRPIRTPPQKSELKKRSLPEPFRKAEHRMILWCARHKVVEGPTQAV